VLLGKKVESEQHGEYWQVTISRWAIRKSKLLAVDPSNSRSIAMTEQASNQPKQIHTSVESAMVETVSGAEESSPTKQTQYTAANRVLGGLDGEIEYEVHLLEVHAWLWINPSSSKHTTTAQTSGGFGGVAGTQPSTSSGGGASGGLAHGQNARKWFVWRSAAEVLALHGQLLSVFGETLCANEQV
jgi:hypothetical protein